MDWEPRGGVLHTLGGWSAELREGGATQLQANGVGWVEWLPEAIQTQIPRQPVLSEGEIGTLLAASE